ncbi:TorF family putative porin [Candidatus Protochlamydia phocaeensis]|uniref:TorF family putative porin n=1 Tax=Candidatus Protochlamydia phocaeensis TaxID=1414722 RepID=UPI0008387BEA|nr:TorF family putative porin [Candidatus Protochlamydia phocaeensis]
MRIKKKPNEPLCLLKFYLLVLFFFFANLGAAGTEEINTKSEYPPSELNNQPPSKETAKQEATEPSQQQEKDKKEGKKEDKEKGDKDKKEEKKKSPHSFTGSVSIVSDYRDRGLSDTLHTPAIQGGFDYAHESGFYLGTWATNTDRSGNLYNNASMEWDIYGGFKSKVFPCYPDFSYNVGLLFYYYPGGQAFVPKRVKYNTLEYYVEFTFKEVAVKLSQTLTDFFAVNSDNPPTNWDKNRPIRPNGHSYGSLYIEASWTHPLYPKWTLLLHAGYQTVTNYWQLNYADWLATLTREFDWLNIFVTYVGTNGRPAFYDVPDHRHGHPHRVSIGDQGVVFGVNKKF